MENIKMSFVSLQRILRIVCRTDACDQYEQNTLRYLFSQCNEEEKTHLIQKFGDKLPFLRDER